MITQKTTNIENAVKDDIEHIIQYCGAGKIQPEDIARYFIDNNPGLYWFGEEATEEEIVEYCIENNLGVTITPREFIQMSTDVQMVVCETVGVTMNEILEGYSVSDVVEKYNQIQNS